MTARRDEELLQAALDGTLSNAEAARLRERVAQEPALRARADELRRLTGLIGSLGPSDPPQAFADRVMDAVTRSDVETAAWWRRARWKLDQLLGRVPGHLQQGARSRGVVRWNAGLAGGGDIVAKKALWAVAGIAVIAILAVVYFTGIRTVDQGAQGTIGGAERYRGAQPAAVGVKEGNAQKFFQTDTFDRLIKDQHVLKLLADREVCELLASPELAALLKSDTFRSLLADAEFEAALKSDAFRSLLADAEFEAALKSDAFRSLLADAEFEAALKSDTFRSLLADAEFEAALKSDTFRSLLADAEFEAALKSDTFRALLAEEEFMAALKHADFRALIGSDPDFQAALRDTEAMDAALMKKAPKKK